MACAAIAGAGQRAQTRETAERAVLPGAGRRAHRYRCGDARSARWHGGAGGRDFRCRGAPARHSDGQVNPRRNRMKRIYGMAMLAALFALAAAAQDAVTEKQRKDQDAVMKKQLAEDISAGLKQMTLVRME